MLILRRPLADVLTAGVAALLAAQASTIAATVLPRERGPLTASARELLTDLGTPAAVAAHLAEEWTLLYGVTPSDRLRPHEGRRVVETPKRRGRR